MTSVGVVTAGPGLTIAHELGHRRTAPDRGPAKLPLTTVCYRHFDIDPARPYPLLRHHDDDPQLPTGCLGVLLAALVPPLWFGILNPRVQRLRSADATPGAGVPAALIPKADCGSREPIRRHAEAFGSPFADEGVGGRDL